MSLVLRINSGTDNAGRPEAVSSLTLIAGQSLALVGPTGSGKSELLTDVEQLADKDTPSGRQVFLTRDQQPVRGQGLIATLSQRTNFIMDAAVGEFVKLHAASLGKQCAHLSEQVVALANTLCGEPMHTASMLQRLSGGQTRALMIADIALLSDAPVVLIDEIENAGIDKHLALQVLSGHGKISIIATHDPVLMLSCPTRLVMAAGGMSQLFQLDQDEQACRAGLEVLDNKLLAARERLRNGERLKEDFL